MIQLREGCIEKIIGILQKEAVFRPVFYGCTGGVLSTLSPSGDYGVVPATTLPTSLWLGYHLDD